MTASLTRPMAQSLAQALWSTHRSAQSLASVDELAVNDQAYGTITGSGTVVTTRPSAQTLAPGTVVSRRTNYDQAYGTNTGSGTMVKTRPSAQSLAPGTAVHTPKGSITGLGIVVVVVDQAQGTNAGSGHCGRDQTSAHRRAQPLASD